MDSILSNGLMNSPELLVLRTYPYHHNLMMLPEAEHKKIKEIYFYIESVYGVNCYIKQQNFPSLKYFAAIQMPYCTEMEAIDYKRNKTAILIAPKTKFSDCQIPWKVINSASITISFDSKNEELFAQLTHLSNIQRLTVELHSWNESKSFSPMPQVNYLKLTCDNLKDIHHVLEAFTKLETLVFYSQAYQFGEMGIELEMKQSDWSNHVKLDQLKSLQFASGVCVSVVNKFLDVAPNLEELYLEYCCSLEINNLSDTIHTKLEKLYLNHTQDDQPCDYKILFKTLLTHSPNLKILHLKFDESFDSETINHLDECLSALEHLIFIEISTLNSINEGLIKTRAKHANIILKNTSVDDKAEENSDEFQLDSNTKSLNPFVKIKQLYLPKINGYPHPAQYCSEKYDDIIITEDEVKLIKTSSSPQDFKAYPVPAGKQLEQTYEEKYAASQDVFLYSEQITIQPGKPAPLNCLSPIEKLISYDSSKPVKVVYLGKAAQPYIMLEKEEKKTRKVNFKALVQSQRALNNWPFDMCMSNNILNQDDYIFSHTHFEIKEDGRVSIVIDPEYQFSFKSSSTEVLIAELILFCKSFTYENNMTGLKGLNLLNTIIRERKGVCRHRTLVFKAMAKAFNIPCLVSKNKCHMFVEVKVNQKVYQVDLGGGPAELEIIPFNNNHNEKSLAQVLGITSTKNAMDMEDNSDLESEMDLSDYKSTSHEQDNSRKRRLVNEDEKNSSSAKKNRYSLLTNIIEKAKALPANKRNVMLKFETREDILAYYAYLAEEESCRLVYIDDISQISFHSLAITDEGKPKKNDSELIKGIKSLRENDILLVNWSDYEPENVGYNSLMDVDYRRLESVAIAEGVIVIGAIDIHAQHRLGDDVYDRCSFMRHPPTALIEKRYLTKNCLDTVPENKHIPRVDLDGGEFWERDLLGILKIQDKRLETGRGELVNAALNNSDCIHLVNGPSHSREFKTFIIKLLRQRKFEAFGIAYTLPQGFSVIQTNEPYTFEADYKIENYHENNMNQWIFPLNEFTYLQFIQNYKIQNQKLVNTPGWISQCQNGVLPILVNGMISDGQWQRLMRQAKLSHCSLRIITKQESFLPERLRANDNSMQDSNESNFSHPSKYLADEKSLDYLGESAVSLITSNDIDFAAILFKKSNTHVVSIANSHSYNDLWDGTRMSHFGDEGFAADFAECDVIQWLKKDDTVVIKGQFAREMAARMSTLFAAKPYLWINGEMKFIDKGKLILLTDDDHHFGNTQYHCILPISHERVWNYCINKYQDKINNDTLRQKAKQAEYASLSYCQIEAVLNAMILYPDADPLQSFSFANLKNTPKQVLSNIISRKQYTDDVKELRLGEIVNHLRHNRILCLVGPSGTGKSTIILDDLKPYFEKHFHAPLHLFVGLDDTILLAWATCPEEGEKVLFIDEANLELPGALDKFESLFDDPPSILIGGKYYPLKNHKVVFAGNFANYAGRYEHALFKRHGSVMVFDEWPKEYLKKYVLQPILKFTLSQVSEENRSLLCDTFLSAYDTFKSLNIRSLLTLRNLHDMCMKAVDLIQVIHDVAELGKTVAFEVVKHQLKPAEQEAFATLINLDLARHAKIVRVVENNVAAEFKSENFILTETRHALCREFKDAILIRQLKAQNTMLSVLGTKGIYIEGISAAGKSAIAIAYLKSIGFVKLDPDAVETNAIKEIKQKRMYYYHFSATSPAKLTAHLTQAFHEGALVIIDEINTLPLEKLLNALLMNRDLSGKKPKLEGFFIIATGNPATLPNRKVFSLAQKNRFLCMTLNDYSFAEKNTIAVEKGLTPERANKLVTNSAEKNSRTFFRRLDKVLQSERSNNLNDVAMKVRG